MAAPEPSGMRFTDIGIKGRPPSQQEGVTPRVQLGEAFTFRTHHFRGRARPVRAPPTT